MLLSLSREQEVAVEEEERDEGYLRELTPDDSLYPFVYQHFFPAGQKDLLKGIQVARSSMRRAKSLKSYVKEDDEFFHFFNDSDSTKGEEESDVEEEEEEVDIYAEEERYDLYLHVNAVTKIHLATQHLEHLLCALVKWEEEEEGKERDEKQKMEEKDSNEGEGDKKENDEEKTKERETKGRKEAVRLTDTKEVDGKEAERPSTMIRNNQESRRKYWATPWSIRSLISLLQFAHFACVPCCAHLFTRLLPHSLTHSFLGK